MARLATPFARFMASAALAGARDLAEAIERSGGARADRDPATGIAAKRANVRNRPTSYRVWKSPIADAETVKDDGVWRWH